MRLIHYTPTPQFQLTRLNVKQRPDLKPRGLWVSVEGEYDWKWWCEGENFRTENLKYSWEVKLKNQAGILIMEKSLHLDNFTALYSVPMFLGASGASSANNIDWARFSMDYKGIIIAPYQWSKRMDMDKLWYYGWDCASGCIWDMNAIESVELLGETAILYQAETVPAEHARRIEVGETSTF